MLLDNVYQLIVIKKFNDTDKGLEYYRAIENKPETFSSLTNPNSNKIKKTIEKILN